MMEMTPLTALAPQATPPGPRTTSMRSMSDTITSFKSQNTPENARLYRPAVDQYEQLVGEGTIETADRHCPIAGTHLRDLYAWSEPQNSGRVVRPDWRISRPVMT